MICFDIEPSSNSLYYNKSLYAWEEASRKKIKIKLIPEEKAKRKVDLIVHDGKFHSDDVLCVAIIAIWNGLKNKNKTTTLRVLRTRNESLFSKAKIVADVGDGQYDHHQKNVAEFTEGVPHCAATLLARDTGLLRACSPLKNILAAVAAKDNGITPPEWSRPLFDFLITFNPPWYYSKEEKETNFINAVNSALNILKNIIISAETWRRADDILEEIQVYNFDREIINIHSNLPGWQNYMIPTKTKLVVFMEDDESWIVQSVPICRGSFEVKIKTPQEWRCLRNLELETASGIKDAVFCHKDGFLSVWKTKEAAFKAAEKILSLQ